MLLLFDASGGIQQVSEHAAIILRAVVGVHTAVSLMTWLPSRAGSGQTRLAWRELPVRSFMEVLRLCDLLLCKGNISLGINIDKFIIKLGCN